MGVRREVSRLLRRLYPGGSLGEQTLFSTGWVFLMKTVNRGLSLATLIILGRLLGPAPIGVYGLAILAIAALESFTEHGITEALIHRREENVDELLHTTWGVEVIRGLFIAAVLFAIAPIVASFFEEPAVRDVLRAMAIAPIVFGLRNPGIIYFRKSLEFHKQFGYQVSGSIVQFVVAVGLGYYWQSIWALVAGYIALEVTRTALSFVVHGFRPRPELDVGVVRELIGYGKWITGTTYLYFLYNRGDDFVVGWLLTSTALGWYQMAFRIAGAPASEISGTLTNVLFPTFSKLQDQPAALREAFYKAFQITLFVSFPMTFGIVAVAPPFVRAFLGPEWVPMTTALQLLALFSLQMAIGPPLGSLFQAIGRPDFSTRLSLVRAILMVILVFPATSAFGIEGTAAAIVVIGLVAMLPLDAYLLVEHSLETSYRRFFSEIAYPLAASSLMFVSVILVQETVSFVRPITEFAILVLVGVVSYAAAVMLLVVVLNWSIAENIRWLVDTASNS